MSNMERIHVRPPEIEDRQLPVHLEGDPIKGETNTSAVGTLDERTSQLVKRDKLPELKLASGQRAAGLQAKITGHSPTRLWMTYDQGMRCRCIS